MKKLANYWLIRINQNFDENNNLIMSPKIHIILKKGKYGENK